MLLNCALKLAKEIILYYDARSKKHQITYVYVEVLSACRGLVSADSNRAIAAELLRPYEHFLAFLVDIPAVNMSNTNMV